MDWNMYMLIQKPAYQALTFVLLTPIILLLIQPRNADAAWTIAAYTFGVFLLVNAGLLWFDDRPWQYFFQSIGFAVAYLLLIAVLVPALIKVMRLSGSEESAMAFLILIYQPFALLLVMVAKWAVTKWF